MVSNGVIFTAKDALAALLKEKFPVDVSVGLITLNKVIFPQYQIIEEVRQGLIKQYGDPMPNGGIGLVGPNDPDKKPKSVNWDAFIKDVNELFNKETEITFKKVVLPRKVTVRCDKCGHVVEKPLEIEPDTLMKLETFIEVATK